MKVDFKRWYLVFLILLAVISLVFHWNRFSLNIAGIHAARQAHTQQNILNFYRVDSNILNPSINMLTDKNELTILRYEFPVMQWSIAMVFRLTGESMLVTRILMFLLGLLSVGGMFYWFKLLFQDNATAFGGAWAFSFSPLFYYFTLNPLPDNLALCSAIWAMAFFFKFLASRNWFFAICSAVCISLSVAAKLPFIIFLSAPGAWVLWGVLHKGVTKSSLEIRFAFLCGLILIPPLCWYGWVIPKWNNDVVTGMLTNKVSIVDLINLMRFHMKTMFPVRLLGYVSVVFFLTAIYFLIKHQSWRDARFKWLAALGITVLVYWLFEFNMIGRVHDYYMMPFLPVLYILVGYGIRQWLQSRKWIKWLGIGLLACMPFMTYRLTAKDWSIEYAYFVQDVFRYQDELRNAVPQDATCIIINDPTQFIFPYLVDKYGFIFRDDHLPAEWVRDMITRYKVAYMYCDSRIIDINPDISQHFERLIMERGNVRVYKLKKY